LRKAPRTHAQDAEAYKSKVTAIAEGQAARFLALEQAYSQAPKSRASGCTWTRRERVDARSQVLIDTKGGQWVGRQYALSAADKLLEKPLAMTLWRPSVLAGMDGSPRRSRNRTR